MFFLDSGLRTSAVTRGCHNGFRVCTPILAGAEPSDAVWKLVMVINVSRVGKESIKTRGSAAFAEKSGLPLRCERRAGFVQYSYFLLYHASDTHRSENEVQIGVIWPRGEDR